MGVDPSPVWVIRNQVCLSCKLRYPEAVIRVGGKQFQECRCGISSVAHRDMEFVCGDDAKLGIPKFPPKLMPDCGHLHRLCGPRRVLDRVNTRAVARKRTTTIRIGMMVQASSICVLPYTCAGSRSASATLLRNFTTT